LLNARVGVLYFCTAGKDRTGVVSAVLLYKLGLPTEYVVRDYMRSRENLAPMLAAYAAQHPDVDINVITPNEGYIREFLAWYIANNG
jgi:protein tyrosine/serine phosphatase